MNVKILEKLNETDVVRSVTLCYPYPLRDLYSEKNYIIHPDKMNKMFELIQKYHSSVKPPTTFKELLYSYRVIANDMMCYTNFYGEVWSYPNKEYIGIYDCITNTINRNTFL